ncbi:MAG: hypothetical protein GQ583_10185, partial [Methyloprofundus sp.]|nr:hypothetical protein [Methyloprofundus sp.]
MQPYNFILFRRISLLATCLLISNTVQAKWSAGGSLSAYYTDDVGLFSVTRRLSLDQDPTQPVVDEPNQGADAVYEPNAYINWNTENKLGEFQASVDAGGYIFHSHSDYTHAFFQLAVEQSFTESTKLKLYYDFIPKLFVGKNSLPQVTHSVPEEHNEHEADEQLDSHLLTLQVEHELTEQLILRGLVRYGARLYKQPFSYRDTQLFTVGSHLEWIISPDIELLVGYHFERGYTDKDETIKFLDDIGYIN